MPTVEKAASDYTDYVKKRATVVGRREFSDSLFNSLVLQSSVGRGLGNTPDVPPPSDEYGILTGFSNTQRLIFPTFTTLPSSFTIELFFKYSDSEESGYLWNLDPNNYFDMIIVRGVLRFDVDVSAIIGPVLPNIWYHVAVSYDGSNWYTSIDGVTTAQTLTSPLLSGLKLFVGTFKETFSDVNNFTSGSISNFRVSNTALYTTDFTVPTLPLQSDATTLLLLLAKSPTTVGVDSSSYKRVAEGTCGWLAGPIEYPPISSYGVISGFSETSYLTSDLSASGDCTVECFVYIGIDTLDYCVFYNEVVDEIGMGIFVEPQYIGRGDLSVNRDNYIGKWTHIAAVYVDSENVSYMYVDGVNAGSIDKLFSPGILYIGSGLREFPNIKISNFRVSSTAKYTENFTPSLPLIQDGDTSLLIRDSIPGNVTPVGTGITIAPEGISYTPYRPSYGVISGFSYTSYLTVPTADLSMSGDFTVECFAYITPAAQDIMIFGFGSGGDLSIAILGDNINSTFGISILKTPYLNKWSHFALVHIGDTNYVYVDGVNFGNYIGNFLSGPLAIGNESDGAYPFDGGKISNFRVSNYARYTNDFIPTLPLTADTNTTLLLTDSLTNSVSGGATITKLGTVTIAPEVIVYGRYA